MPEVTAIDHALQNGNGVSANGNATSADPGGMTNDEKVAVGGLLNRDESKGAAVHVCSPTLPAGNQLTNTIRHLIQMLRPSKRQLLLVKRGLR